MTHWGFLSHHPSPSARLSRDQILSDGGLWSVQGCHMSLKGECADSAKKSSKSSLSRSMVLFPLSYPRFDCADHFASTLLSRFLIRAYLQFLGLLVCSLYDSDRLHGHPHSGPPRKRSPRPFPYKLRSPSQACPPDASLCQHWRPYPIGLQVPDRI
jgi:hypothetical protein